MTSRLSLVVFVLVLSAPTRAAEQTWRGVISDSACGAAHEASAEGADKMSDRDCTAACVKGGSKYVLVVGDTVYKIANQSFDRLAANAGQLVTVTGEMDGDAVKVAAIVP